MIKRVCIADDHQIMREGLRSLLESKLGIEVLAEAADGQSAVRVATELRPDVMIMDVAMPLLNGIEATRRIRKEAAGVKVLALSMHSDRRFVTRILRAGASGYLLKDCAFDELALALDTVSAGLIYLSPGVTGQVVEDYVSLAKERTNPSGLTTRERQVLQPLAEGKTTKEIARLLRISVKTIETHRKQIMDKLDLHSVAELTKYAIREGLTSL